MGIVWLVAAVFLVGFCIRAALFFEMQKKQHSELMSLLGDLRDFTKGSQH